jgi:hypothetical protein
LNRRIIRTHGWYGKSFYIPAYWSTQNGFYGFDFKVDSKTGEVIDFYYSKERDKLQISSSYYTENYLYKEISVNEIDFSKMDNYDFSKKDNSFNLGFRDISRYPNDFMNDKREEMVEIAKCGDNTYFIAVLYGKAVFHYEEYFDYPCVYTYDTVLLYDNGYVTDTDGYGRAIEPTVVFEPVKGNNSIEETRQAIRELNNGADYNILWRSHYDYE